MGHKYEYLTNFLISGIILTVKPGSCVYVWGARREGEALVYSVYQFFSTLNREIRIIVVIFKSLVAIKGEFGDYFHFFIQDYFHCSIVQACSWHLYLASSAFPLPPLFSENRHIFLFDSCCQSHLSSSPSSLLPSGSPCLYRVSSPSPSSSR